MNKLKLYETMDHRIAFKVRQFNNGYRGKGGICNKGSGVLYIVSNNEYPNWFKVGVCKSKLNFKQRLGTYKSTMPIGKWDVNLLKEVDDIAFAEIEAKHYFRYGCNYELGVNSCEWFKGDWKKFANEVYNENYELIDMKIPKKEREATYTKAEAKVFIKNLYK